MILVMHLPNFLKHGIMSHSLEGFVKFCFGRKQIANAFNSSLFQTISVNNHKQYIKTLYKFQSMNFSSKLAHIIEQINTEYINRYRIMSFFHLIFICYVQLLITPYPIYIDRLKFLSLSILNSCLIYNEAIVVISKIESNKL